MKPKLEMQHKCVELRKQGMSFNQIARALNVTRGVVAGHLHRARKQALERGLTDDRQRDTSTRT